MRCLFSKSISLGTVILAALGAGLYTNVEDAVDKMLKKKKVYEPNMKNHEIPEM